jgi:type IV secretory pathway TrbD component
MLSDNNLLLRALRMNAIFSGFSSILMFVAGRWLAGQFGLESPVTIYAIGGFLALFALQLANIVRTREIRSWEIKSIISGDLAWVAGSIVLIAFYYQSITAAGLMLVDIIAVAVLFFAILQIKGLRELGRMAR